MGRRPGLRVESPGMNDDGTEDQKVAAVAASMTMAGQPMTAETEHEVRRILRGEITADQSALQLLEQRGLGDSARAHREGKPRWGTHRRTTSE